MKPSPSACLLVSLSLLLSACNGPANPEKYGREYLLRKGQAPEVVEAVLGQKPLKPEWVAELTKSSSSDVRFLVATNPSLTPAQLGPLVTHSDDFTRSGAARNPHLTPEQRETLFRDPSHTVYAGLAGNSAVPEEMLLRLHRERKPGLLWFALNPKCPATIQEEIKACSDDLAKQWLETTQKWAKEGIHR